MRYYRRGQGGSNVLLVDDPRPTCPECRHTLSEEGELHYPDCRFFQIDDETAWNDDDAFVVQEAFAFHEPPANAAT